MSAAPNDAPQFPEPLEFFERDFIHPDNLAVMEAEQRRWRLLSFRERLQLRRYVNRLARELRRAHYLTGMEELRQLRKSFRAKSAAYASTRYIHPEAKAKALADLRAMATRGEQLKAELSDWHPTFEAWRHYAGWLDYEREHRRDLKIEDKRERRIRKEMRQESAWLERIIYSCWRRAPGCHYTYKTDKGGSERTKIPKFERCVIKPDAHWFYLRTRTHFPILGWRYRLPDGVTTERLRAEEIVELMRAATGRQVDWFWTEQNQLVLRISRLDAPDALPKLVKWRDAMTYFPEQRAHRFPYTIGVTEGRKFHWLDLVSDTNILIAGTQGSGKSNQVNGIIATWVSTHSPEEFRLVLIDQKGGMEFTHWEELPHLLWEMVNTLDDVKPVLTKLVGIMRRRTQLLKMVKAKDLATYNNRVDAEQRLERVAIVVDEMSNFVGLGALTEEIQNLLMLLVSQGRAVGMSVITATQHPEVKVIPGRIKTNIPVRLSGWMPTIEASRIVLGNPEAARLPKVPGRFVMARGMEVINVQCPHISDEDIAGIVGAARLAYPDVANDLRDMRDQPALTVWNEQRTLKAVIEWLEGHLSGAELHKHLGEESPGERHFKKMCRALIDQSEQFGYVTLLEDGSEWTIRKRGKGYYLEARKDKSDEKAPVASAAVIALPPVLSEKSAN